MTPRYILYRWLMKLMHRSHLHYMPPIYPDGDTQFWCKWCGIRHTDRRLQINAIQIP